MDALLYDLKVRVSVPRPISPDTPIVIVDIDEKSLKEEGRWPWPRWKLARLLDRFTEGGVLLGVFDLVLSEAEANPSDQLTGFDIEIPEDVRSWLGEHRSQWDSDLKLTQALTQMDVVLGTLFHEVSEVRVGRLVGPDVIDAADGRLDRQKMVVKTYPGYSAPLATLMDSAIGSGSINVIPDADGVVRRAPLLVEHQGHYYPSLALESARQFLLENNVRVHTAAVNDVQVITHLQLADRIIPTDAMGSILVPYMGRARTFPTVSATDVLRNDNALSALDSAIVLVGTSALALADLRPTPVMADFPGIEIQASVLNGLLHPELLVSEPDWIPGAVVVLLAVIGLLIIGLMPVVPSFFQPLLGLLIVAAAVAFNYWVWTEQRVNMPLFTQVFLIFVATTAFTVEGLARETREKRKIRLSFGQYVPVEHIARLQGSGWTGTLSGERREMTVLFSDIRDFTHLSENLDATQLREFLNHYLTPITEIIFATGGTIDKYVGDMVMAFWNAPLDDPRHASHAVEAALKMQAKITQMQGEFQSLGVTTVAAGIGIHTGEMNVGDMGSEFRRAYTVLGDAVNLGSRLEGLTKYYGVPILTSELTRSQCPDMVFRYVDRVRVKGKEEPVSIYHPLGEPDSLEFPFDGQTLAQYEAAIRLYLDRRWPEAAAEFLKLCEKVPQEYLYRLYLERARHFAQDPPGLDWTGVFVHTSK